MQDFGGLDIGSPDEGGGDASEQAREQSEQSKAQQAQAQAAAAQQRQQEQRAKRRDDGVVEAIVQFLTDAQRTHLSVLIARLVERDCPSSFILAVLSLINERCLASMQDALEDARERGLSSDVREKSAALVQGGQLSAQSGAELIDWIERLQLTLAADHENILKALQADDRSLDGTVLQLSAFVLQDFFAAQKQAVEFDKSQLIATGILQVVFEPYF